MQKTAETLGYQAIRGALGGQPVDGPHNRDCPRSGGPEDRLLLKGGIVFSLDPDVGSFEKADVLVQGKKILAVGLNLGGDGQVIDCSGMIIMPGFINTHHHQFYSAQRANLADGNIRGAWPQEAYFSVHDIWTTGRLRNAAGQVIWDLGRSPYDPDDCYIAELLASVNQINQGVTTGVDTSQCSHTPEHTDAMIEGLAASGRRTVYTYSYGRNDQPGYEFPGTSGDFTKGLGRIKSKYFSSEDQLLTLAMSNDHFLHTGFASADIEFARSLNVPVVQHGGPTPAALASDILGPDMEYIHCTHMSSDIWRRLADAGCHVSIAPIIEMQMGHGIPPLQEALDHGILPSLSSDVETNMTADMFTLMRSAMSIQRMLVHHRARDGETNLPPLLTCNQVLQMATVAGAVCAHVDGKVGTLTPGKEADIIMLEARSLNVAGFNNVPGAIVTLMDASNVRNVMIAGNIKKWGGSIVGINVNTLADKIEQSREKILSRINSKPIPIDGLNSAPGYSPSRFGSCCISHRYDNARP
jgi:5-methylthioadenosine/S-adenosylhomocysteine deaminase